MKTIMNIPVVMVFIISAAAFSFASSSPLVVDASLTYNSGILVLAFAGFLALVVVVQLVPAMTSLYTMLRKATEESKRRESEKISTDN